MLRKAIGLSIAFAFIYKLVLRYYSKVNRITFDVQSKLTKGIVDRTGKLLKRYNGPWWLVSGTLQTAITEVLEKAKLDYRRENLVLEEMEKRPESTCCPEIVPKGTVSLDWLDSHDDNANTPIVLIIPGLTGDSSSGFVTRAAYHLRYEKNYRVACYSPRGRGGNEVDSAFLYSVGYTEDLRRVIQHIRDTNPNSPLFAAGYSLGSNYLAKYVGEEGENSVLSGAICLACPIDCMSISNALENTFVGSIIFNPILVSSVQRVRESIEHLIGAHPKFDLEQIKQAKTMHSFDHHAIAPMFDFSCASDYYRWSSAGLWLNKIKIPTLFIHAENDPIVPGHQIKLDNFHSSPYLINCMSKEGGHSMDWPEQGDLKPWSAKVIGEFVNAVQEHKIE